ncbi:MAG: Hsp20/alpha crystallin family protein [Cyclobacteriaceae bacterium]|nr:Hsp20/alpha crystallin family protein [Cyclobacteriaceae bacterium]
MNILDNKTFLRDLLGQSDLMSTVNGGVRKTEFSIKKVGNDILIEVSNPSIAPESFNFTINKNELLINVMRFNKSFSNGQPIMYPLFFKVIQIPYYVDINRIEATFENGVFKVLLPYNNNLPDNPFRVHIKNIDN